MKFILPYAYLIVIYLFQTVRMWGIQNFEIWTRLNKIWNLLLGQYNYNLDYLSLFVKFMFIFILFDVVLIALLKVFRENNVSIFSHSLHTCLLANCIDISSGYSVWPGIRFKYKSCIERKIWVNCTNKLLSSFIKY